MVYQGPNGSATLSVFVKNLQREGMCNNERKFMRSQLGGGQMAALKKQGLYQITLRALELKSRSNHTRTILDPHSRSTLLCPKLENINRVKFFKGFEFTPSSVRASLE